MKKIKNQVDIVYLWVNSNDKNWQKKRRKSFDIFLKKNKKTIAPFANTDGRFRDNGELAFNLRSLEKFFPDHGHIYIVTDEQKPNWLKTGSKVTIIDHRDIIPKKFTPIFASSNIETYIHHIPNLSEKFIYLNDDVFFGAPVNIDCWFKGKLKYFFSKKTHAINTELQSNELSPVNGSILSSRWLNQKYPNYIHQYKIMAHSPKAFLKTLLFKAEEVAEDLFINARSVNFRKWTSPPIIVDFVPRWLEYNNYAEIIEIDELYIESGASDLEKQLEKLAKNFGKIPFFCINDTCDDVDAADTRLRLVREGLKTLLPNKSSFEI